MHQLRFWFDPISPYAWLAFEALPQALQGLSIEVTYQPVLFAGLLKQHAHKGPAEIEPKRQWTFRHVAWLAQAQGSVLQPPAQHPFNPLALLRLGLACAPSGGCPNRRVTEALFRHVWCGEGADANEAQRLAQLRENLAPVRDPEGEDVKAELRAAGERAVQLGVFGVPSIEWQGRIFWGLDALPMLRQALRHDPWFEAGHWEEAAKARGGVVRP